MNARSTPPSAPAAEGGTCPETGCRTFFVARQPVLDRKTNVIGYELFIRPGQDGPAAAAPDATCPALVADGLALAVEDIPPAKTIFLGFGPEQVLEGVPLSLPPERCVLEINPQGRCDPAFLAACDALRGQGYTLCLCGFRGEPNQFPVLDVMDMVGIHGQDASPEEILRLRRSLKGRNLRLRLNGIGDWEVFEGAKALGFELFQGDFFYCPLIRKGKRPSARTTSRMRLVEALNRAECDLGGLCETIAADTALSYRLLKFINTPALGLPGKVKSIPHALALLGLSAFKGWVTAVVLADLDDSSRGTELGYIALRRGFFLSELAGQRPRGGLDKDSLFLLGLLSNLDALLGQPMDLVVAGLALEDALKAGLCGDPGEARDWLDLVAFAERGDWDRACALMDRQGLKCEHCALAYLTSARRAGQAFD